MLLFGGKMQAIQDYDHELNYIFFQYRSLKRKAIKPFLTLMRGLKYNKQQVDPQSLQKEDLITPLSFLEKYIENGQNAERFYNQQQTESADSSPIKKFMSENQDFFHQQLSEMANRFGLFQVEQQENVENTASQQKQQSQQAQNDNKMLLKLSQNDIRLPSQNVYKQQLQEFKYFMKKAINDQNLKLNLDNHARTLSEQKQKELNQHTGTWSDLRSDSSKQNTTQSERKLKNNDSSPQSKQADDNTQKIAGRQVFFQKNIQTQESIDLLRESTQKNSGQQQQVDWYKVIKHEHDQEYESQINSIAHQRDNEAKYLQTIKQSQNEFYETQLKFDGYSTKRSSKKTRIVKDMNKINKLMNQDMRTDQNQSEFYQQNQSHTKSSIDQYHSVENFQQNRINRLYNNPKQNQIIVDTFLQNKAELELHKINHQSNNFSSNNYKTNNNIMGYARTYRPNSFVPQNIPKRCLTQQAPLYYNQDKLSFENHQLQTRRNGIDLRAINNHSQQVVKLEESLKGKNIPINNQQYGKKSKATQILSGVSYAHSFKKQKQKDEKQKTQIPKAKNKVHTEKMHKKILSKPSSQIEQTIMFEVIEVKDSTQKQSNQEIKKNNNQSINQQQQQIVIRSQPLKRQSKNQNIIKSASYLQHSPRIQQQNGNNEVKQSSQIKIKSISGTKSDQQYTLLKMMGGSDHLKELSSLVIQPKQLCFQTDKQQLAHFMAANNISIKSEPSYDQSEDVSMNSQTFRFTPNNLTSFNLEDALKQDSKGVSFNDMYQKQRKQLNKNQKTQLNSNYKKFGNKTQQIQDTDELYLNQNEQSETYQPLFVNYKKFNNNIDQLEMPSIEQLQSNKITSNSPSDVKVQPKRSQDYRNHFNPKRALSRMKQQQRGVSQYKVQNVCKHEKQYRSVSRCKRIQGAIQGVKKRWQKNALRFKTKMYNS